MYMFYPCIAVMEFVISGYMFYRFGQTGSNTSLGWAVFAFGIGILASCLQVALMYDKTYSYKREGERGWSKIPPD